MIQDKTLSMKREKMFKLDVVNLQIIAETQQIVEPIEYKRIIKKWLAWEFQKVVDGYWFKMPHSLGIFKISSYKMGNMRKSNRLSTFKLREIEGRENDVAYNLNLDTEQIMYRIVWKKYRTAIIKFPQLWGFRLVDKIKRKLFNKIVNEDKKYFK
jgi:hypothetical protein